MSTIRQGIRASIEPLCDTLTDLTFDHDLKPQFRDKVSCLCNVIATALNEFDPNDDGGPFPEDIAGEVDHGGQ